MTTYSLQRDPGYRKVHRIPIGTDGTSGVLHLTGIDVFYRIFYSGLCTGRQYTGPKEPWIYTWHMMGILGRGVFREVSSGNNVFADYNMDGVTDWHHWTGSSGNLTGGKNS
jgi:hypothetical protein